jgi:thiol-disulfide isomerase/thioredoxin
MTYSSMPKEARRTWIVPRLRKEAFVAFALVSVLTVGISKAVQHFGGGFERARAAVDADSLDQRPAPPILLPARGGGELDLSKLRGKLVLVNFWATWCPPCREEMPSLEKLAASLEPGSFEVVAVSVDEGWAPVEKFLAPRTPLKVALDEGGRISRLYGTAKFPESYLVDAQGNLRLKFVGPRRWDEPEMYKLLESLGAKRKG